GDVLAEGVFALLDDKRKIQDADKIYWQQFIAQRRLLIDDVLRRTEGYDGDPHLKAQMIESLKASRGRLLKIKQQHCAAFLDTWQEDLISWRRYLDKLPRVLSIEEALGHLGVGGRFTARWNRAGPYRARAAAA